MSKYTFNKKYQSKGQLPDRADISVLKTGFFKSTDFLPPLILDRDSGTYVRKLPDESLVFVVSNGTLF